MNSQNIIDGRINFKSLVYDANLIPDHSCFTIPESDSLFQKAKRDPLALQGSKLLTTSKNLFEK